MSEPVHTKIPGSEDIVLLRRVPNFQPRSHSPKLVEGYESGEI